MTLVVIGAAKGSPGVTTSVVALAASWPTHREPLLVEADGSGGDLIVRMGATEAGDGGLRMEPSTVQLAAASRAGLSERDLLECLQLLPGRGSVRALVAPPSSFSASSALDALATVGLVDRLAELSALDVLVDVGRVDPGSTEFALVRTAGTVVLVVRPSVASVIHTRDLAAGLSQAEVAVSLLIIGDSPFAPSEIARAIGAYPVIGVLADDPSAAAALDETSSSTKTWTRGRLLRGASTIAERLAPPPPVLDETRPDESSTVTELVAPPVSAGVR